jgi:hypothetical protein
LVFFHPGFSRACFVSAAPSVSNVTSVSHDKAEIGGRNSIRRIGPSGADHEKDDEEAAFCCAEIGTSGQGAV